MRVLSMPFCPVQGNSLNLAGKYGSLKPLNSRHAKYPLSSSFPDSYCDWSTHHPEPSTTCFRYHLFLFRSVVVPTPGNAFKLWVQVLSSNTFTVRNYLSILTDSRTQVIWETCTEASPPFYLDGIDHFVWSPGLTAISPIISTIAAAARSTLRPTIAGQ